MGVDRLGRRNWRKPWNPDIGNTATADAAVVAKVANALRLDHDEAVDIAAKLAADRQKRAAKAARAVHAYVADDALAPFARESALAAPAVKLTATRAERLAAATAGRGNTSATLLSR